MIIWVKVFIGRCPIIDFVQVLDLIFKNRNACKLAEHLKDSFDECLLEFNPCRCFLIIVILNNLLEFFELRVVIEEEGVNS